jgi:rhodanese-related sulfurtransferase
MWGAINIPLQDIRDAMGTMDRGKEYITACGTSRRAAAAAFILAQNGFRVCVTGLSSAVLPFGAA